MNGLHMFTYHIHSAVQNNKRIAAEIKTVVDSILGITIKSHNTSISSQPKRNMSLINDDQSLKGINYHLLLSKNRVREQNCGH